MEWWLLFFIQRKIWFIVCGQKERTDQWQNQEHFSFEPFSKYLHTQTHLKISDHSWINVFHSNFITRMWGVCCNKFYIKPLRPCVIMTFSVFHVLFWLVNVCVPNWDDANFANKLLASLPNLIAQKLILEWIRLVQLTLACIVQAPKLFFLLKCKKKKSI